MSEIKKLFPYIDNDLYNKLLIDDESRNYISMPFVSIKISQIILNHCKLLNINPTETIITDATAGVGGNTFAFCKVFNNVNAIEIDPIRYKYLINNINTYGFKNTITYCDDALKLISSLKQDIIFFDPPWGGRDYKLHDKIKLTLSNINIENICVDIFKSNSAKLIALKLPKNYDLAFMYEIINKSFSNARIFLYRLHKMFIVILHF